VTNYHVLSPDTINKNIQIDIHNKNNITLNFDNYIKYMKDPDITAIKLKNLYKLNNEIEFLGYDSNYLQYGYEMYKNIDGSIAPGLILKLKTFLELGIILNSILSLTLKLSSIS
jgi:hypothetical protein